ncbi:MULTISPECIES: hypothetical protein [unclassified Paraburkholderia]|uniref:hypothetical protein n=1 Tax=unclassified Paraburkholderia TaxID=2615204 RepID=UPI00161D0A03|nr:MULTISPECIES: hypothetical protein [unclassified Paraburkholderia]MBB5441614.1 hypothetical protein [Paraburkholderia sp. WSM4177]MBB5482009.1 hypothetical protein [Paraburkholderia sp. WSM4180]
MFIPYAAPASNIDVARRQQTSLSQSLTARDLLVLSQVDDGGFLVTAPRAQRRTRSVENSPAVRRQVKLVEPVDTELHPQPRLWMLNAWQNDLFSRFPLFFRAVHHPDSYPANISHFGIQCGVGWYPIIEALARDVEFELRTLWREQLQFPEKLAALDSALVSGRATYPLLPICTDIEQVLGKFVIALLPGKMCPTDVWGRIRKYVEIAEASALCICESCGKRGTFRESYWRRVYCDDCIAPEVRRAQVAAPT